MSSTMHARYAADIAAVEKLLPRPLTEAERNRFCQILGHAPHLIDADRKARIAAHFQPQQPGVTPMPNQTQYDARPRKVVAKLAASQVSKLAKLGQCGPFQGRDTPASVEEVAAYILGSIADGVRRPGSWEAQLLSPMFGW